MLTPIRPVLATTRWRAPVAVAALALTIGFGAPAQTTPPAPTPAAMPSAGATPAGAVPPMPEIAAPGGASPANPYGLASVWREGDLVARSTLLALAIMSLGSWYIIVAKLLEQRRLNRQSYAARLAFAGPGSLRRKADALDRESVFRFVVDASLEALQKHEAVALQVDMNTWLAQDIVRNVGTVQLRLQSGLSVLATVGSTAPFVGLFGTVWGIYHALVTIGVAGQASIDKVAGPVGEALIMTALGLAVAVPAVLGYNWLVRRNRLAMHTMKGFSSDLHTLLLVDRDRTQRATQAGHKTS